MSNHRRFKLADLEVAVCPIAPSEGVTLIRDNEGGLRVKTGVRAGLFSQNNDRRAPRSASDGAIVLSRRASLSSDRDLSRAPRRTPGAARLARSRIDLGVRAVAARLRARRWGARARGSPSRVDRPYHSTSEGRWPLLGAREQRRFPADDPREQDPERLGAPSTLESWPRHRLIAVYVAGVGRVARYRARRRPGGRLRLERFAGAARRNHARAGGRPPPARLRGRRRSLAAGDERARTGAFGATLQLYHRGI